MRNMFITLFLCTVFSTSYAANWMAVGTDTKTVWTKKSACESIEKDKTGYKGCFDISEKNPVYHDISSSEVDDTSKPIMKAKYSGESCDSPALCLEVADNCDPGDWRVAEKNAVLPGWTSYCVGIASYEKKTVSVLVENADKKTAYEADKSSKAIESAEYAAVEKSMKFGTKMIAMISIRNSKKGLSKGQVKQVVQDYELINDLLRAGAIDTAKDEITALAPDGTRIVQADKDALLAEINAFLGQ